MNFFLFACIFVIIAAFFDQFTTQLDISVGDIEGNKTLDWIYGTNKPTPLQGYGFGALAIAAEIAFYFLMHRYAGVWIGLGVIFLTAEAFVHVACAISNYHLYKTGKALFTL